jgi:CBS-domain-containing membrane protein
MLEEDFERLTNLEQPVEVLVGMNKESETFHVAREEDTLLSAVEAFSWGLHRLLVVGHDGSAVKILTQTDVVAYLSVHFA